MRQCSYSTNTAAAPAAALKKQQQQQQQQQQHSANSSSASSSGTTDTHRLDVGLVRRAPRADAAEAERVVARLHEAEAPRAGVGLLEHAAF